MKPLLIALLLLLASALGHAADPRFTVVRVDPSTQDLRLYWGDAQGQPFRRFDRLAAWLKPQKRQLVFGMNAGMYEADGKPVGLLVMGGTQMAPLNTASGDGNFFLKPNGVFLLAPAGPRVVESSEYPAFASGVRDATQSGPLLLRHGVIHPAFNPSSTSRLIRNGVGVSGGSAFFVISEVPVSFHEFAVFFRDTLHCQDALYLDGVVSSLHDSKLQRSDLKATLGPIFGVVQ